MIEIQQKLLELIMTISHKLQKNKWQTICVEKNPITFSQGYACSGYGGW